MLPLQLYGADFSCHEIGDFADEQCEGRILFLHSWRFFVNFNLRDLRDLLEYFFLP